MFKVPKDYEYANDQTIGNVEYRIAPNDIMGFSVYTNDGFKLVDLTTSATSVSGSIQNSNSPRSQTEFLVEPDGMIKLPIIGKFKIAGMTVREAEKALEQQYATFYNKPFVMIQVLNRRVLVFPGSGGAGRVVSLTNENTSLVEALALAGGITNTGKAWKIKLIRGDLRNPKVMLIDLSTIEGLKQSNTLLQANDILYVEPVPRYSQEIFLQLAPLVGIITSVALVINIAKGL
ncbi:polysaccharide biosynthesis/export family protein [soil metagenome]